MFHGERFQKTLAAVQYANADGSLADGFGEEIENVLLAVHAQDYRRRGKASEGDNVLPRSLLAKMCDHSLAAASCLVYSTDNACRLSGNVVGSKRP